MISFGKKLAGRDEKDDELLTRLDLMYSAEVRNYTLLIETGYSLAERVYKISEDTAYFSSNPPALSLTGTRQKNSEPAVRTKRILHLANRKTQDSIRAKKGQNPVATWISNSGRSHSPA